MERRLIDANALKESFEEDGHLSGYIEEYIDNCPTISAVEVVRCRECKKRREAGSLGLVWCRKWGNVMTEDDFCSYGERREPDGK